MEKSLLGEFQLDWRLAGKSPATELDYKKAICAASTLRDKALVEVLWSCGLRRSEIARLDIADVNFSEGFLVIRTSKTGKPRIAPLSPSARHALRKHIGKRSQGSLFGMTTNAIRLCLKRLGAPSAHAAVRFRAVEVRVRCRRRLHPRLRPLSFFRTRIPAVPQLPRAARVQAPLPALLRRRWRSVRNRKGRQSVGRPNGQKESCSDAVDCHVQKHRSCNQTRDLPREVQRSIAV